MLDQETHFQAHEDTHESPSTHRAPGELLLDTQLIDRTLLELDHIKLQQGLHKAAAIGRCLLRNFFGGDRNAYHSKNRRHRSFRELAKRRDLPFSASTLRVSIAVFMQLEQLPEDLGWKLTVRHHRALLPIIDINVKTDLARKAVMNRVTVRDLEAEVSELAETIPKKNRGGRPRLPELVKRLRKMSNALERADLVETDPHLLLENFELSELRSIHDRIESHLALVRQALEVHPAHGSAV